MLGGRSIQLARIFGIRIGADLSWFVFLFVVVLIETTNYKTLLPRHDGEAFALAIASAFLFVLSIVLHELGHAVVAMRSGIGIAGIDLWMFGGLAKMRRDSTSPGVDLAIAVAGPLVTLAIAGICFAIGASWVGPSSFVDAALYRGHHSGGVLLLSDVCAINAILLGFNLLPGLPLDGGRIVRAIAWWRTGDRVRATRVTAATGRGIAYIVGAAGVYLTITGSLIALWLVFVAVFLAQAARSVEVQTDMTARIEHVRVADIMDPEPVVVPAETKLDQAVDDWFTRYGWDWFPVVDVAGRFMGLVSRKDVDKFPHPLWKTSNVSQVMEPDTSSIFRVRTDEPLEALLGSEALQRLGAIMAVDGEGVLKGVVTIEQVSRALQPFVRTA